MSQQTQPSRAARKEKPTTTHTDATAIEVVRTYYELLQEGPDHFEPERLRALLHPELEFEGPIAGRRVGAEPFLVGAAGFIATTRRVAIRHLLSDGSLVAALYDAELPGGTVRFAEFLEVEQGRIRSLRLLYDAAEYRNRGGR